MSGLKAPLHGRTHLPGGSDPITPFGSGIQFDTDPQEGGYLHVSTTGFDASDGNFAGIGAYATGGNPVVLGTEDSGWVQLIFNQDGSGGGEREIRITDSRILEYTIRTSIDMFDGASAGLESIILSTANASMRVLTSSSQMSGGSTVHVQADSATGVDVKLAASTTFTVTDHLANPLFRVDEDGDVHILTGKTITADL